MCTGHESVGQKQSKRFSEFKVCLSWVAAIIMNSELNHVIFIAVSMPLSSLAIDWTKACVATYLQWTTEVSNWTQAFKLWCIWLDAGVNLHCTSVTVQISGSSPQVYRKSMTATWWPRCGANVSGCNLLCNLVRINHDTCFDRPSYPILSYTLLSYHVTLSNTIIYSPILSYTTLSYPIPYPILQSSSNFHELLLQSKELVSPPGGGIG